MIKPSFMKLLPAQTPDEVAAYWFVQMQAGSLDKEAQAEFDAWRMLPVHGEAFERTREIWDIFDYAKGDPHVEALRDTALAAGPASRRPLWRGLGVGIAASLFAVLLFGLPQLPTSQQKAVTASQEPANASAATSTPRALELATAKGEQRKIRLADGSRVTLNTDSAVRVAFVPDRRLITILRGEALFEVAKDRGRPFVVQAGDRCVTAVGTMFNLRLQGNRMQVTLVEGKVVVDRLVGRSAARENIPVLLTAGHELMTEEGGTQTLTKVDVEQQIRWRDGFVEFADTPLSEAVEEMNRYSAVQLVFDRPGTGRLRVSGTFRTGNPERFMAILPELLLVQSRKLPNGNIEIARKSPTSP